MQSHSGVKPFHYDVCAKRFTLRHHLTRHQKIHSGVKLYECSFRDKQFVERAVLSQHMENIPEKGTTSVLFVENTLQMNLRCMNT